MRGKKLEWGGCTGCLTLEPDGTLATSWGKGRWGKTSTASYKDVIFAKFVDVVHLLKFDESGAFRSIRHALHPCIFRVHACAMHVP